MLTSIYHSHFYLCFTFVSYSQFYFVSHICVLFPFQFIIPISNFLTPISYFYLLFPFLIPIFIHYSHFYLLHFYASAGRRLAQCTVCMHYTSMCVCITVCARDHISIHYPKFYILLRRLSQRTVWCVCITLRRVCITVCARDLISIHYSQFYVLLRRLSQRAVCMHYTSTCVHYTPSVHAIPFLFVGKKKYTLYSVHTAMFVCIT